MKNIEKILFSLFLIICVFFVKSELFGYSEKTNLLSQTEDSSILPAIEEGNNWFIMESPTGTKKLYMGESSYDYMNIASAINEITIALRNKDNNLTPFTAYDFVDNEWVSKGIFNGHFVTTGDWYVSSKGKDCIPYGYNTMIKSYPKGAGTILSVNPSYSNFVISHNYKKVMLYCAPSQYDGVWVANNNGCDYFYRPSLSSTDYYELDCWEYNASTDIWLYQGKADRTVGNANEIFCTVGTFIFPDGRLAHSDLRKFLTDKVTTPPNIEIGDNWFTVKNSSGEVNLYAGESSYDYMNVASAINEVTVALRNKNDNMSVFISHDFIDNQWISKGVFNGHLLSANNANILSKGKEFLPYGYNTMIKSYPKGERNILDVDPSYSSFVISHNYGKVILYCAPVQYEGIWVANNNGCDYFYRPNSTSSDYYELDYWQYNASTDTWLYQGKTNRTVGNANEIFCTVGTFIFPDGQVAHSDLRGFLANKVTTPPNIELGNNWFIVEDAIEGKKLYVGDAFYDYISVTGGLNTIQVSLKNQNNNDTGNFIVHNFIDEQWVGIGTSNGILASTEACNVLSKGKNFMPYGFDTKIKFYPKGEGDILDVNPSYSSFAITNTNGKIMLYAAPVQEKGVWVASSSAGCNYFYRSSASSSEYFDIDKWRYDKGRDTWVYEGKTNRTEGYPQEHFCTVGTFVYTDGRTAHPDLRRFFTSQYIEFIEKRFGKDGIDACSGNYSKKQVDFELSNSNIEINFSRTYNSLNEKSGIIGKGWTFGFESNVKQYEYDPNLYMIYLPNGSIKMYTKQTDGSFVANDSRSTLCFTDNTYIYTDIDQTQYEYGSNQKLERIKDKYGNTIQIIYNNTGNIEKIVDLVGREYRFTYNGTLLTEITDPLGRRVIYHYTNDMLTSVENVNGTESEFEYDDRNVLTQIVMKDFENKRILLYKMEYITEGIYAGKIAKLTNESGNITTYTYNIEERLTTETDSNGRVKKIYYDEEGYPIKIVEPNDAETVITYQEIEGINKYGEESSKKDIYGNLTSYERDNKGNIIKEIHPDNSTKQYIYNSKNKIIKEIDELGHVTETIYDNDEVTVLKVIKPLDGTTPYDANQNQSLYEITTYTYYEPEQTNGIRGLIHIKKDKEGEITYEYDSYGNVTKQIDGENTITTYSNNVFGWKLSEIVNENGYVTTYEYNNKGDITKIVKDGNTTEQTTYNYQNKPIKVIDGNGNEEIREYDTAGNVMKYIDKEGNATSYTYDLYGNIINETKANGVTYEYNYDTLNRLTTMSYRNDETGASVLLQDKLYETLDGKQVVTTRNYTNEQQYKTKIETFDYRNSLIKEQNDDNIKEILYYTNGMKSSENTENGGIWYYYYTNTNHLEKKYEQVSQDKYFCTLYNYDNFGRLIKEKIGKEKVSLEGIPTSYQETNYEYNSNGKVVKKTTSSGEEYRYEYDSYGNTIKESTKISDLENNEYSIIIYEYNYLNKKTRENRNGLITAYEYDGNGNVVKMVEPENIITTYNYNKLDKLITTTLENEIIETTKYDVMGNIIVETDANGNETKYEYDKLNNVIKVIDANNGITTYENDLIGRVLKETTPNNVGTNNKTTYEYDNYDNIKEKNITFEQNGETVTISTKYDYDQGKNIIKKVDPDNKISTMEYNKLNKLTQKVDENGNITTYQYDYACHMIQETNPKGNILHYEYDERGNLLSKKLKETANSELVSLEANTYDLINNKLTSCDAKGNRTTYTYDKNKNLLVEKHANGYEKLYTYNDRQQVTKIVDNMNKEISYQYDSYGNVIKQTEQQNIDGRREQAISQYSEYDKNGNVTKQIDGNGNSITYQYDRLNNKIAEINAKGQITTYTYDRNGNLLKETNFVGNSKSYRYDPIDRLIEKKNELGEIVETLEYDKNSRQAKNIDGIGNQIQYVYDNVGNLIKEVDQEGNCQIYGYDKLNNKISFQDKNGKVTTYEYNYAKKVTKVINPLNEITRYEYDANNNLIKMIDAKNQETTYTYDVANNEISETDGLGKIETKTYYMDGELASKTTKKGNTIQYTRDIHGRLVRETDGEETIFYEYDNKENILKITRGMNQTIRKYDELDRVVIKTENGLQSQFTYDIINTETGTTLEKTVDANTNEVIKEYDKVGRLYKVVNGEDVTIYSYYVDGSTKSVIYGNGVTEAYSYYPDKTLLKLVNTNGDQVEEYSYEYDKNNNISKKNDAKGVTNYTYDALNRIVTIQTPTNTTMYEYDTTGNRIKEVVNSTVKEYTYNAKNQLTKLIEKENAIPTKETMYRYDENGNQVEVKENGQIVESNVYSVRNELIQVTKGEETARYAYNGEGNRIEKQVGEEVTKFVYEVDKVILELDGSNNEKAVNVYGLTLISRETGADKGYYLYNGHGDVETIVSSSNEVLNTYYYDAYGNIKEKVGEFDNPYTYAGYYYDKETESYYLQSRYYRPEIGRFISEDSYRGEQEDPLSLNRYTYAHNNPLRYNDPDGHFIKEILEGIEYVGKRVGASVHAAGEFVYDIGKGAFDLGWEIGEWINTGDASTLKQMPMNMIQGIGNNFATTFNWDNFKNYWNPDTSYTELKDYSNSVIQTGTTIYGGIKTVKGITNMVNNVNITPGSFGQIAYNNGMAGSTYIVPSVSVVGDMTGAMSSTASGTMLMTGGNMGNISNNQNKLNHIFNKQQHNLNDLLDSFKGDQTKAFDSIKSSTEKYIKTNNINGNFKDIVIKVNGFDVTVRGTVINGQVNIGTVFIP